MSASARHVDPKELERSLSRLRARDRAVPVAEALEQVLDGTRVLFGATGAGLMAIDEGRALCHLAATDEAGRVLEATQERVGEGPCVDALVYGEIVHTKDLAEDERWPRLKPEVPDAGVRAVLGVPVHVAGESVGALNVYMDEPYEWDDSDVRGLQSYAELVGSLLTTALQAEERSKVIDQLQRALNNRVVIERAVGMVMGREDVDAVTAFNRLRTTARSRRQRVAELAEEVLQGASLDPE
jgi:GAF domain-containing protein